MSYEPVVAGAARAAARQLVPQYGAQVEGEVAEALYSSDEARPPSQFLDPVAVGSLIVAFAQLAFQIYSDRKKKGEKPTRNKLTVWVRAERRTETDLTATEEKIIEIVSAEIIQYGDTQDQ